MTDEQKQAMNVAIAEKMGWKWKASPEMAFGAEEFLKKWHSPDGKCGKAIFPPDFTGSLDAMVTAEATLDPHIRNDYVATLWEVCGFKTQSANFWTEYNFRGIYALTVATAAQRAEAFCRLRKIGPFAEGKG